MTLDNYMESLSKQATDERADLKIVADKKLLKNHLKVLKKFKDKVDLTATKDGLEMMEADLLWQ